MHDDPSQPLVTCSNHPAGCAPLPGRNLRRITRWLRWTCWLALAVFVAVASINRELGWDQWHARLRHPSWVLCIAVLAFALFSALSAFRSATVSSAWAGLFALGAITQLFQLLDWSNDPKDVETLHKAAVMMGIYTVVLALMHDRSSARGSSGEKSPSEVARTSSTADENE